MFKKFRNFMNRERHQHCHRGEPHRNGRGETRGNAVPEGAIPLDKAPENKRLTVVANSDIKTMEMGLYPGSMVSLIHNESQERNIIVKIHDQRYVVPREIAKNIFIKGSS